MPAYLAPGRPRPGKGLGDLFLSQLTVTDDRGHRSQAGIPAGPVEVRELVLLVPHTLQNAPASGSAYLPGRRIAARRDRWTSGGRKQETYVVGKSMIQRNSPRLVRSSTGHAEDRRAPWNRISMISERPGVHLRRTGQPRPIAPSRRLSRIRIKIEKNVGMPHWKCRSPLLKLVIESSLE
jgi:hypothetical protein